LSYAAFDDYLTRWALTPDGDPIVTRTSRLLPVRWRGVPAILKVAMHPEEKLGNQVMQWWEGVGTARVLAHDDDALLLERAVRTTSLADLARTGRDDEASRIICHAIADLHTPRKKPLPILVPLTKWFADLESAASVRSGFFARSAAAARELLATPKDVTVLHGDIHHGNVLDFGERGWLAVDPKGAIGERAFDYANMFCNPDHDTAAAPGHFARRVEVVGAAAQLDRARLLKWILAWSGLSAVWSIGDGESPETALAVAELAAQQLSGQDV
jgi:streptomycin 6-kinase